MKRVCDLIVVNLSDLIGKISHCEDTLEGADNGNSNGTVDDDIKVATMERGMIQSNINYEVLMVKKF